MLQRDDAFETTERVYRVTLNPERWRTLDRIRQELGDETQIAEALAFLGEPGDLYPALCPTCSETHFIEHRSLRIVDFRMANLVFCTPLGPLKLRATNMHIGLPAILPPRQESPCVFACT